MLVLLAACVADGPLGGCDVACPVGTRRIESLTSDVVVSGQFSWSSDRSCEVLCESIQPCLAPNVPVVDGSTDPAVFACEPLDGMSSIPLPSEVDTSFGLAWREVPDPVVGSLPIDGSFLWAHDGDGDGLDDLYTANGTEIAWARSNGDATFTPGGSQALPEFGAKALGAGDLDGDGWLDLAWVSWTDDQLRWLRATGSASWGPPQVLGQLTPQTYTPVQIHVADLDQDGFDDLVVQNWATSPRLQVLFGGAAGPAAPVPVPIDSTAVELSVGWGDVDGDGLLDLATTALRGSVARQTPARGFELWVSNVWDQDYVVPAVDLQDLDDDGLDDLWAAMPGHDACDGVPCLRSWLSDGAGLVAGVHVPFPDELPSRHGEADLDGDGRRDTYGANFDAPFFAFGVGTGEVGWVTRASPVAPYASAAGDFDGDGLGELACAAGPDLAVVYP